MANQVKTNLCESSKALRARREVCTTWINSDPRPLQREKPNADQNDGLPLTQQGITQEAPVTLKRAIHVEHGNVQRKRSCSEPTVLACELRAYAPSSITLPTTICHDFKRTFASNDIDVSRSTTILKSPETTLDDRESTNAYTNLDFETLLQNLVDDGAEEDRHDETLNPQEVRTSNKRTRRNTAQKWVNAPPSSATEIGDIHGRLRSYQEPRHQEEKSNIAPPRLGKKPQPVGSVQKEKLGRTQKHTRMSPESQYPAEAALQLYMICNNGKTNYSVRRVRQTIPRWEDLASLSSIFYAGETYSINDTVYILLQGGQDDSLARIRQIRDLGDGRKLISVLWYYSQDEVEAIQGVSMRSWPKGCSHMLSTQVQVLMWDTMNGKVRGKEVEALVAEKVIDVFSKPCRILDQKDPSMEWLS
jgi:hypothetical protein